MTDQQTNTAVQFTGTAASADEFMDFMAAGGVECWGSTAHGREHAEFRTPDGLVRVEVGDWVTLVGPGEFSVSKRPGEAVRGVQGVPDGTQVLAYQVDP